VSGSWDGSLKLGHGNDGGWHVWAA
jgi:predicted phage tail protein